MGQTPTCPEPRELQRLGHGELSEEEADKLSEHILTCSTCADRLNAVCTDDPIAASLGRGVSPLLAGNPTVDALIDRLARRPPDSVLAATALEARIVGAIFQRKGDMFDGAGKTKEALEQYQQALAVFQKMIAELPAEDPQREIGQYNVAVAHTKIGDIGLRQGNAAAAREHHQEALRMRKALAQARLKSPELQNPSVVLGAVAHSCVALANLSLDEGDLVQARDHFREAHKIREKLVIGPQDLKGRHALVSSYGGLAQLSFRLNDRPAARKYCLDFLKLMQELTAADPVNVEYKTGLAACYERLGDINLFWGQDPARTLAEYQRGHQIREALLKREPTSADRQTEFATSNYRLGTANLWLGRKSESEKYYQESLKAREKLSSRDPVEKAAFMLSLARCGQHVKAAELADVIRKATSGDRAFLFSAACGYALSIPAVAHGKDKDKLTPDERALQQRYADKAIDTLREGIAKGFNHPVTLETDPDLEPIQKDPRFKELLKNIGKR